MNKTDANPVPGDSSQFLPTATIENLRKRSVVLQQLRRFFETRGFWHVETPIMSADTVVDRYIEPVPVRLGDRQYFLQTSPEFAMKRLLVAGADSIYQITRAIRADERGRMHNPEFTMLEWYRVGDSMRTAMNFLGEVVEETLGLPKTELLTYREAFRQHAGIDPYLSTIEELSNHARHNGLDITSIADEQDRDMWLNFLLANLVESKLGLDGPTIVYDWPASQSALAVVRNEEIPVAERFEIYVRGVELANGYHELLDAEELLSRNKIVNEQRNSDGKPQLSESSYLVSAMRKGLPDCCGVALGVDRLVMLAVGANSIGEVIAFGIENA